MTNWVGDILSSVARQYTLRTWIEYGFKQVKNELGWHDYRLTEYSSIERWWELIFSAYLLVSLHADAFQHLPSLKGVNATVSSVNATVSSSPLLPFSQHPHWELGMTWKSALNNLRLLLQPYCCWGWLEPWLQVFPILELVYGLEQLMDWMDTFRLLTRPESKGPQVSALKVA